MFPHIAMMMTVYIKSSIAMVDDKQPQQQQQQQQRQRRGFLHYSRYYTVLLSNNNKACLLSSHLLPHLKPLFHSQATIRPDDSVWQQQQQHVTNILQSYNTYIYNLSGAYTTTTTLQLALLITIYMNNNYENKVLI